MRFRSGQKIVHILRTAKPGDRPQDHLTICATNISAGPITSAPDGPLCPRCVLNRDKAIERLRHSLLELTGADPAELDKLFALPAPPVVCSCYLADGESAVRQTVLDACAMHGRGQAA